MTDLKDLSPLIPVNIPGSSFRKPATVPLKKAIYAQAEYCSLPVFQLFYKNLPGKFKICTVAENFRGTIVVK